MALPYLIIEVLRQEEVQARKIQRRAIRDACNPFELPEREFQRNFRLSKELAMFLCEELEVALRPQSHEGLPVHIKVLASVRLLGDGNYQRGTGQDHSICIAQTTVSKYLKQFINAVVRLLLPRWVVFPGTQDERQSITNGFRAKHGLPDILGAIDCTQIAIFPPKKPEGIQFANRHGYASINTQLIVDVNCRILNINARYPGRVHDQFIFNNSIVKEELTRLYTNRIGDYYLLGDSGYALVPWLMTPKLNPLAGSAEERFTKWHCQVRNCVERTNGYLKGTFRCLGSDRSLHYSPEKSSAIIYACATLYNLMLHYRVPMLLDINNEVEQENMNAVAHNMLQQGRTKRERIIATWFN